MRPVGTLSRTQVVTRRGALLSGRRTIWTRQSVSTQVMPLRLSAMTSSPELSEWRLAVFSKMRRIASYPSLPLRSKSATPG